MVGWYGVGCAAAVGRVPWDVRSARWSKIPNNLVRELVAVDRLATRAVVVGEVTALQHEALAMVVVEVVVVVAWWRWWLKGLYRLNPRISHLP